MSPVRFEALEDRQLLSAPAAGAAAPVAAPPAGAVHAAKAAGASVDPAAGQLTLADRQALLSHFTDGPLRASLAKTLRYSGADAFDASLLKYMYRRDGPLNAFSGKRFSRELADAPTFYNFAPYVDRADAVLAHPFPEQVSATSYAVQLPAGTIDWLAQPATTANPNFLDGLNRQQ